MNEIKEYGFIKISSLNNVPNFSQTDNKLCELTGAEIFAFTHSSDLESRSRSIRVIAGCVVQQFLSLFPV